jgi:hypothetical protein
MSTAQDDRPVAAVIPLPRPAAPTPAPQVPGAVRSEGLSPREVLVLSSRRADLSAATVEAALEAEDLRHAEQLRELVEHHQQRRALLVELAGSLGQQCIDLDEAAAALPAAAARPGRIFGFAAGDRVQDPRTGATGRVRFHVLSPAERAEGFSTADVMWDGSDTGTDLELAVAHGLHHVPGLSR